MDNKQLLSLIDVDVKLNGQYILQQINFNIHEGQHWALVGSSGAGKSAFLNTIIGKLAISHGAIQHHYAHEYLTLNRLDGMSHSHQDLLALTTPRHQFKNKAHVQGFYYQQRFNSMDADDADTVYDYLTRVKSALAGYWTVNSVTEALGLEYLLDKSIIKLSNGETRRLTIALALLRNPKLLLMDQPLIGLDAATRANFDRIIERIIASGVHIIICTSPTEIPKAITHIAVLEKGKMLKQGPKETILKELDTLTVQDPFLGNRDLLREELAHYSFQKFNQIVYMKDVSVKYDDRQILDHINWEILQGERWVLQGHNGAGKSTLLSLINGDNPQAYANHIILFDRKRGSGESIWDIKKKIGFVSPELHQYFPADQTCLQVIISGFYDTDGLFRKASKQQEEEALRWLNIFGIQSLEKKRLRTVSTSEQRLCLLARALVKKPPVLILDEPCQGLSTEQRDYFKMIIDEICKHTAATIIYVSHYVEDIPETVDRLLKLKNGKIITKKP
ncbi:ATP-binding cassette domain-containing protein [Olivibacter ginsenosidimutans]|uniref:ATP-binding cassette domain-containing protein n=1 Tax=Olivibacter ginsenosidimutans TaxID=1176537 RepID=A0ABP9AXT8_9SPHI